MKALKGNAVFAQSGGPTTVINASICGALEEAIKSKAIGKLFGARNGILGVLTEELFDLRKERPEDLRKLKMAPSAALGSCRYKVKKDSDFERILDVFKAHDIRYFFYAGGNDSMDTADKVAKLAASRNYEMRVMGIPKTIDNDLAFTDHCPGFGSVAKYLATMIMEAGRDTDAMYTSDTATVVETMGRNAGWIAAATGVARRSEEDAPHLVYVPEIPLSLERLARDVREVHKRLGRCFVVVSEGCKDEKGNLLAETGGAFATDAFGHRQLGGIAEKLGDFIEKEVGIKCRRNKPGTIQRNGMHFASRTDVEEAYMCGKTAVRLSLEGTSGFMVTLVREKNKPYKCGTGLAKLSDVANGEKYLPRDFMNEEGNHISKKMREYVVPLMKGEAKFEMGDDGLPVYVRLKMVPVQKKCSEWKP